MISFGEGRIKEAYQAVYDGHMNTVLMDPRSAPSVGIAGLRYNSWFHDKDRKFLKCSAPEYSLKGLMRFRLGCTSLNCRDHTRERTARTCTLCSLNVIEDELHLIHECPYYRQLRMQVRFASLYYRPVFVNAQDRMRDFMNQDNQYLLCDFICILLKRRNRGINLDLEVERHNLCPRA
jgi:hypothetical protein